LVARYPVDAAEAGDQVYAGDPEALAGQQQSAIASRIARTIAGSR